jgi:hypothetical protein
MLMRGILSAVSVLLWLSIQGQAFAQWRLSLVCWANVAQIGGCPPNYRAVRYDCGSGGHSSFNSNWVCQQQCGADEGDRCRVTVGLGGKGGQCGWQAARIYCLNSRTSRCDAASVGATRPAARVSGKLAGALGFAI